MRSTLFVAVAVIAIAALSCCVSAIDCSVPDDQKKDCGYVGINQQLCEGKGCCWVPAGSGSTIPWCFYPNAAPSPPPSPSPSPSPPSPPPPSPSPPSPPPPPGSAPFSDDELATMTKYFLNNINIGGKGGVVASPDTTVPGGGSYYYHWMRDAALSMRTVWSHNTTITNSDALMQTYISFVLHGQSLPDPNQIDIRGEPKFMLPNGEVFTSGWCRPQNDGAGLEATTLMIYALDLIKRGDLAYVQQYLWTSGAYNGGAIKFDLDYVAVNWNTNTCDLWEEIQSNDIFWNRFNHRRALLMGADFATIFGDTASATKYRDAAGQISQALDGHWTGTFVQESQNRQKDAAVVTAFNNGYNDDGVYGPTDEKVAATVAVYNDLFNSAYPINTADTAAGVPGVLYGRYEGDHYGGGCPWVLTTAALAQLYYRGASEVLSTRKMPSEKAMVHFRRILNVTDAMWVPSPAVFAKSLVSLGDGVLLRIRYHTASAGFHQPEQLDKNTGAPASATDLTWSYSAVLEAMRVRGSAVEMLAAVRGAAEKAEM